MSNNTVLNKIKGEFIATNILKVIICLMNLYLIWTWPDDVAGRRMATG
jgi:hypothetical protein